MDKRTILGFVLIMAILLLWQPLMRAIYGPPPEIEQLADSLQITENTELESKAIDNSYKPETKIGEIAKKAESVEVADEPEKTITIETKNLIVTLSSIGGTVQQVVLKEYERYDGNMVNMIGEGSKAEWTQFGALTIGSSDYIPEFNKINFKTDGFDKILYENDSEYSVVFTHSNEKGSIIRKEYVFYPDDYIFDLNLEIKNSRSLNFKDGLTIGWFAPMEPSEKNIKNDNDKLGGFFSMGTEFDYYNKLDDGKLKKIATGETDWVASRTKYFASIIIANEKLGNEALVLGTQNNLIDSDGKNAEWKQFGVGMTYSNPSDNISLNLSIYTGPLDYYHLLDKEKNLVALVELGWKIFRPFAIFIQWIFHNLHKAVPNYGWVIVIFSVLMKLIFWPLSIKSAKSMHKMKMVQPLMQEAKAKFKDDPAKLQQETMKIYKEHGVNPFGSCLPMLVQLPIFWAMFSVLSNSIALRGAEFIFWIKDLSQPDPTGGFLGISLLPGILPIIMGVSMFIQQKMTITDPKQKMMIYLMPALFMFLFSQWASGLVLYWTVFNIMGIGEQWFVKKKMREEQAIA